MGMAMAVVGLLLSQSLVCSFLAHVPFFHFISFPR